MNAAHSSRAAGDPPLVSVIMIFFDAAAYFEEAVDSVLAQSYPSWQLVLVDDGSTDASTEMARGWASRYPERIEYVEHPRHRNRGMSASRNLGLRHARGRYVTFLDADDRWAESKLAEQVDILESRPEAGIVVGGTTYWHSWQPGARHADHLESLGPPFDVVVEPPDLLARVYPLGKITSPSLSNLMARREIVDRVGGFEESFVGLYEDQVFLVKAYLATPIYSSSRPWLWYRQHDESCVAVTHRAGFYHEARKKFLAWLEAYLIEQCVTDAGAWKALGRARWRYDHPVAALVGQVVAGGILHPYDTSRRVYGRISRLARSALGREEQIDCRF